MTPGARGGQTGDSPGVVVFPPVLFGGTLVLGLILHWIRPVPLLLPLVARLFGVVVLVLSGVLVRSAEAVMRWAGTNVRPDQPTLAPPRARPNVVLGADSPPQVDGLEIDFPRKFHASFPAFGSDSRTSVGTGVTGADRTGFHLRAFADLPLESGPFGFRAEVFYNLLTSGPNAFDAGVNGKAALVDRTFGLTGSFLATTSRRSAVAPYLALGTGLFSSSLGHNPDPQSAQVTSTYRGMGLGLVAGGGLRVRVGGPTLLLDWRCYQALYNTRGSSFMPLSIGLAF